jgi:predicted kinase
VIIAMAGLPGSGKSTIARGLARVLPGLVVSKDEIRTKLFSADEIDYSQEQDSICFQEMLRVTEQTLSQSPGTWIILDGRTFSRAADLEQVGNLATRRGEPLFVIQCLCSDESARRRIESDVRTGRHPAANRNYGLYLEIKARQEPLVLPALHLNTDLDLSSCLSLCLSYLGHPLDPRRASG